MFEPRSIVGAELPVLLLVRLLWKCCNTRTLAHAMNDSTLISAWLDEIDSRVTPEALLLHLPVDLPHLRPSSNTWGQGDVECTT